MDGINRHHQGKQSGQEGKKIKLSMCLCVCASVCLCVFLSFFIVVKTVGQDR
jgi:hypothetical protein